MWFMVMILVIGNGDIIIKPYDIYDSQIMCLAWKSDAERETGVTMACVQLRDI